MFYMVFASASKKHITWLQSEIRNKMGIQGHLVKSKNNSAYQLRYAKAESLKLIAKMYYNHAVVCLSRKRSKIEEAIRRK